MSIRADTYTYLVFQYDFFLTKIELWWKIFQIVTTKHFHVYEIKFTLEPWILLILLRKMIEEMETKYIRVFHTSKDFPPIEYLPNKIHEQFQFFFQAISLISIFQRRYTNNLRLWKKIIIN